MNSCKLKIKKIYTTASKMKYLEIKIVKELQDMYTEYHKNITESS